MKILVDIGHPAHVHFFKNFIRLMKDRGHEFIVTARDKDVTLDLLKAYRIDHIVVGRVGKGKLGLVREWIGRDRKILSIARNFRPQILMGIHNPAVAHVARLIGAKSITFTDTEHARLASLLTFPFTNVICTPSCFTKNLGKKQVRYNGYHELAYLHPNYFTPDPSVLNSLGFDNKDKFAFVRFVFWGASHDINQRGFTYKNKVRLLNELSRFARILISCEGELPHEFNKYKLNIPPERIHDVLYYASLYVGEGATLASESAILGIPAIYVSTLRLGYLREQEEKYGLVYNFLADESSQELAIQEAVELIKTNNHIKDEQVKKERLIKDKIDVTKYMVDMISKL